MKQLLVLMFVTVVTAQFKIHSPDEYEFKYDTRSSGGEAKLFRKEERKEDGTIIGEYGYVDPNGELQVTNYRVGKNGYEIIDAFEAEDELAGRAAPRETDDSIEIQKEFSAVGPVRFDLLYGGRGLPFNRLAYQSHILGMPALYGFRTLLPRRHFFF
ncbi:uncharacterized protein LOC111089268 [Limulus polyphemus]|uniref:Uncharacterized protein LOC111089268 n=1 Tax=Limulus polyphemus TaxID=6850 RepID=A0ABM1TMQ3_LIMPO|nr:uncharacterized protein LOC111089268 [Limulus polyphemus]